MSLLQATAISGTAADIAAVVSSAGVTHNAGNLQATISTDGANPVSVDAADLISIDDNTGRILLASNATEITGFLPDFSGLPTDILKKTAAAFICSPSNPQGAIASRAYLRELISLAEQFDFQIFADECYSEIYRNDPPPSALDVAAEMGAHPERVVIFHSLSKRSNLPGLRSGFVAGGPQTIARLKQLRNYAGAPLPTPLQAVAARVWADEEHVIENRKLYQEKYTIADKVMADFEGYQGPEGGFFLWLPVEDGETAALKLWRETGVRVLPGTYLSRDAEGRNPGQNYIRVAMVAPKEEM